MRNINFTKNVYFSLQEFLFLPCLYWLGLHSLHMCPQLERGIFTTCELLGRGKHRETQGEGKMPDYSRKFVPVLDRQVNQLASLPGQGRVGPVSSDKYKTLSNEFMTMLYWLIYFIRSTHRCFIYCLGFSHNSVTRPWSCFDVTESVMLLECHRYIAMSYVVG